MWATCEEAAPLHHGRPVTTPIPQPIHLTGGALGGRADGGIAAGKSLVGRMFEALGLPVWNADDAAKQLYATDSALREAMVERWGDDIGAFDVAGNLVDIDRQGARKDCVQRPLWN